MKGIWCPNHPLHDGLYSIDKSVPVTRPQCGCQCIEYKKSAIPLAISLFFFFVFCFLFFVFFLLVFLCVFVLFLFVFVFVLFFVLFYFVLFCVLFLFLFLFFPEIQTAWENILIESLDCHDCWCMWIFFFGDPGGNKDLCQKKCGNLGFNFVKESRIPTPPPLGGHNLAEIVCPRYRQLIEAQMIKLRHAMVLMN